MVPYYFIIPNLGLSQMSCGVETGVFGRCLVGHFQAIFTIFWTDVLLIREKVRHINLYLPYILP